MPPSIRAPVPWIACVCALTACDGSSSTTTTTPSPKFPNPADCRHAPARIDPSDRGAMAQAAGPATTVAPLRTRGTSLIDAREAQIRLAGVNWYGAETPDLVPAGLQKQSVDVIAAEIKDAGFNSVRLPFSNYIVECDPAVDENLVAKNPKFVGKHALSVYDGVVRALLTHGLMVILDDHSRDAQVNPSLENGLWHNDRYSEDQWVADWAAMAGRFKDVRGVVGADLDNEPDWPGPPQQARATWNEWKTAAERAGRAVNGANPDLLLMVEGVDTGTNISGAVTNPVRLPPDKLVYSVHNYAGYEELAGPYGYASSRKTPLWVGEFGTCNSSLACVHSDPKAPDGQCLDADRKQGKWFADITQYLARHRDISWAYWPLNGTHPTREKLGAPPVGHECYGLLMDGWTLPPRSDTPRTEILCALRSIEDPPGTCGAPLSAPRPASRVVRACSIPGGAEGGSGPLPFTTRGLSCAQGRAIVESTLRSSRILGEGSGPAQGFTCRQTSPGPLGPGARIACARSAAEVSWSLPG